MLKFISILSILNSVFAGSFAFGNTCVIYPADGPFYTGDFRDALPTQTSQLKFVSYNIAANPNSAVILNDLQKNPSLKDADFIMLQEVVSTIQTDDSTARFLAAELKMNYVFSPNVVLWQMDYGNGILSKWPLVSMKKVYLPLSNRENCNQRSFIVGVYRTPLGDIQVTSVHLSVLFSDTFLGGDKLRTTQFRTGLRAISEANLPTFIAGDMNTANPIGARKLLLMTKDLGFSVAQLQRGRTNKFHHFELDRAFARGGFKVVKSGIEYNAEGSDHFPIWSSLQLNQN